MRCKKCGITSRVTKAKSSAKSWDKQICPTCDHNKIVSRRRWIDRGQYGMRNGIMNKVPYAKSYVLTPDKAELYCKLKQIILGRKCDPKKLIASNKRYRNLEVILP